MHRLAELRLNAPAVARRRVPECAAEYERRGWTMFPEIGRVYVNERARCELDWRPQHDSRTAIARLQEGEDLRSQLAREVGSKGYHRGQLARASHGLADAR
jgi:UDP-glucose 4-epimerase